MIFFFWDVGEWNNSLCLNIISFSVNDWITRVSFGCGDCFGFIAYFDRKVQENLGVCVWSKVESVDEDVVE